MNRSKPTAVNPMPSRPYHPALAAITLAASLWASSSHAYPVKIIQGSQLPAGASLSGSVAGAKYRLSNTNWDMSLDAGGGTATPANFISHGLGNSGALNDVAFDFTLKYLTGKGFVYTLSRVSDGATWNLAWGGNFAPGDIPAGTTTTAATLNNGETPNQTFNALHLTAQASGGSSFPNDRYMKFENLQFSQTTSDGALTNGTAASPIGTSNLQQWILAAIDLSTVDWVLTGRLTGKGMTSGGESVKFVVDAKNVTGVTFVPEPSSLAIGGLGGLALLGLALQHRRKAAIS